MPDLPEISDETVQQLATVMHRELEASDPLGGWHFGCIGSGECGKGERAHELLAEDVLPALLAALVASGYRPEADVLREAADRIDPGPVSTRRPAVNDLDDMQMTCDRGVAARLRLWADIRERYGATALDPAQPLPVAAVEGQERSEEPVMVPCECPDPRCTNRIAVLLVGDEESDHG